MSLFLNAILVIVIIYSNIERLPPSPPPCSQQAICTNLYPGGQLIGISDGRYIFDQRSDIQSNSSLASATNEVKSFQYKQKGSQEFLSNPNEEFAADSNNVVILEKYDEGAPQQSFLTQIKDAITKGALAIFFAGRAEDFSQFNQQMPSNQPNTENASCPPSSIPVMGGDALYNLGAYPSGNGHNCFFFSTFGFPDTVSILQSNGLIPSSSQQPPQVFNSSGEYASVFGPNWRGPSPYGHTRADDNAILSYDALMTMITACSNSNNNGSGCSKPSDMEQALGNLNGQDQGPNFYQGASGQIRLGLLGNPINKAVEILWVDNNGEAHQYEYCGGFSLTSTPSDACIPTPDGAPVPAF